MVKEDFDAERDKFGRIVGGRSGGGEGRPAGGGGGRLLEKATETQDNSSVHREIPPVYFEVTGTSKCR